MKFLKFLISKTFLKNFGLALVLTFIVIWFILKILDLYTLHGTSRTVPDLRGLTIAEVEKILSDNRLQYVIVDSMYSLTKPKGTVINQDPSANSKVKRNRIVYITVIALNPERVSMPNLNDITLRQAVAVLETYGLKIGRLKYVPDIAENNVLKQMYKGAVIAPGTLIEKGSKIDLVLGRGISNEFAIVPDVVGKNRSEAIRLLNAAALNIGAELYADGSDSLNAVVVKQHPGGRVAAHFGAQVDLWYGKSTESQDDEDTDND